MQTLNPLRLVGGRAGTLLPWLLQEIQPLQQSTQPVLLIVPEQYTLQAERELTEGLHLPGLLLIQVLSPRRLRLRIQERGGRLPYPVLDERGRCMALSQAIHQVKDQLRFYGSTAHRPGLPSRVSVLLADMEKVGMNAALLAEQAEAVPAASTRLKLQDLALIWQTYETLLAGRFVDHGQQQQDLLGRVAVSHVMDGQHIFVYGFDMLQPDLCDLLCAALPLAASVSVTLVMDEQQAEDGYIFLAQRHTADELIHRLKEQHLPYKLLRAPACKDTRPVVLRKLEQALFSRNPVPCLEETDLVEVHTAPNPYSEAAYTAQRLRAWHEGGLPWGRMAVALASTESLSGILAITLKAAGIPFYLTRKDALKRHGLCRFLLGSVKAVAGQYSREDVLDAALSGFSPLNDREAMLLENYALENGIHHKKWLSPFTRGTP